MFREDGRDVERVDPERDPEILGVPVVVVLPFPTAFVFIKS